MASDFDLVVVGGGPAGMMVGLLFARAGCNVAVLEKHADFFRDFRGDTVHPSTLELLRELGLLDEFLKRPHDEVRTLTARVANEMITIADLSHLPVESRFVAMMPQWEFLDFLAQEARHYPTFALRMEAEAVDLLFDGSRVAGVRLGNGEEVRARLTIAADGRSSVLRDKAGLPGRISARPSTSCGSGCRRRRRRRTRPAGHSARARSWSRSTAATIGSALMLCRRARGLRSRPRASRLSGPTWPGPRRTSPAWSRRCRTGIRSKFCRCRWTGWRRWWRPGLLAIGDAAHAMSPVGGVGINLAVQDAVAAANILAGPLAAGRNPDPLLKQVQARRLFPTRVIQFAQKTVHDRVLTPLVLRKAVLAKVPLVLRLFQRFPMLRRIPARLVGLGVRREHIRSPDAGLRR